MTTSRHSLTVPTEAESGRTSRLLHQQLTRRSIIVGSAATAVTIAASRVAQVSASGGNPRAIGTRNQAGNHLVYALSFDVDGTLDPQVTCFDSTIRVTLNVCEPLVWMPDATTIVPALAESWEISTDGLEVTFKLKQGVTFHDGTPFNAAAVAYTYDRVVALDKYMAAAVSAGTPISAVAPSEDETIINSCKSQDQIGTYDHSEIIDDYTIKMVLARPFAPFLSGLNGVLGIVSPTAVESMGLAEFARKPVGTGPYMVQEWVEADHITLVKNPNYSWGSSYFTNTGPAFFDSIEYKAIPDASIRTGTLLSGETQYIDQLDPLQLADVQSNPDLEVITKDQPGLGWIVLLNVDHKGRPQMDPAVRQALSYAIDKDAFNHAVFGGLNAPASSPLMKSTFGYEPATETMYPYDPARCAELLDTAGWVLNGDVREKDGQKLELYWPIHDRQSHRLMATFIQGALRDVGVIATIEAMDTAAVLETRNAGNHDAALFWYSSADPDALRVVFHSANIGAFNFARYSNPEVDMWLDAAASSADPEERKALYSQVQIKLLEDAVTIPLVDTIVYNAKSKSLQGEQLDFLASFVWMNDATFV